MNWIKIHCHPWIFGPTRYEMTHEERAIFVDILALAWLNEPKGQVRFMGTKQLAQIFGATVELIESTIENGLEYGKFRLKEKQNSKMKILVVKNWKKYQSDYDRQKPYRKKKKLEKNRGKKVTNDVTARVTEDVTNGLHIDKRKVEENKVEEKREAERGEESGMERGEERKKEDNFSPLKNSEEESKDRNKNRGGMLDTKIEEIEDPEHRRFLEKIFD